MAQLRHRAVTPEREQEEEHVIEHDIGPNDDPRLDFIENIQIQPFRDADVIDDDMEFLPNIMNENQGQDRDIAPDLEEQQEYIVEYDNIPYNDPLLAVIPLVDDVIIGHEDLPRALENVDLPREFGDVQYESRLGCRTSNRRC